VCVCVREEHAYVSVIIGSIDIVNGRCKTCYRECIYENCGDSWV